MITGSSRFCLTLGYSSQQQQVCVCVLQGEICDIDGTCVDAADDEIFKLTTKGGSLSMEREKVSSSSSSHTVL